MDRIQPLRVLSKVAAVVLLQSLLLSACQKAPVNKSSLEEDDEQTVGSLSCKGVTHFLDLATLAIEGKTQAQAGDLIVYQLNQDPSCSDYQKVTWKTASGETLLVDSGSVLASSDGLSEASSKTVQLSSSGISTTYTNAGVYFVSAKVEDSSSSSGGEVMLATTITSTSALISGPRVAVENEPAWFELVLPQGKTLVSALWSFGDGSDPVSSVSPVEHAWMRSGNYTVSAKIRDSDQVESTITQNVSVLIYQDGYECANELLVSWPYEGIVGESLAMSVFIPSCLQTRVTSVSWSFGDGSSASGVDANHTYGSVGSYTISLVLKTSSSGSQPWLTLVQSVQVRPVPPSPTPTPLPNPLSCPTLGEKRELWGAESTSEASCGVDGKKTQVFKNKIVEECQTQSEGQLWTVISDEPQLQSESSCEMQACLLPDGGKLAHGAAKVFYSSKTPDAKCELVTQTRTCSNGVLSGSAAYAHATCTDGCEGFGAHGVVKIGVVTGEVQVPVSCAFNEPGVFSVNNQLSDQICDQGQVKTTQVRTGDVKVAGVCPVYQWKASNSWSACSADCGGEQSQVYECRNDKGELAPEERCGSVKPQEKRVCDGNPEAVRRIETEVSQEESGATETCPKNQVGVMVASRDVTTVKTYACINHAVTLESENVTRGVWVKESYCRDYVAHRCSQDSLSIDEARGRYQWMVKCQSTVPVIKEFLTSFADVEVTKTDKGKKTTLAIDSSDHPLYPTFMNRKTRPEKPWIAPKSSKSGCSVPTTAYVAAVCVASCATPEQEIITQAEANLKMKSTPFIEALTQNHKFVATLASQSSMSSRALSRTAVDQWVTELTDTEQKILEFRMKSGKSLRITPNHPVVTSDGGMKLAAEFKVGESLVQLGGVLDEIVSIKETMHFGKVYNVFVKSAELHKNIVVTGGYLNGTAFFQNEGANNINRILFRDKLLTGVFEK